MDYLLISTTLANYYVNLLIIQYHNKPKARATVYFLATLLFANMALLQIRDGFDWQTAVGPQLDTVGDWVGVDRFYNGQLLFLQPWFSLIDWDSTPDNLQGGFSTFETFNSQEGGFLDYDSIGPTQNQLSDTSFSIMIGLKIIQNNIIQTAKNIDDAIWDYFNGKVYTTWEGKTLTYYYQPELREILQVAYFKNILPRPVGVQIVLTEITQ